MIEADREKKGKEAQQFYNNAKFQLLSIYFLAAGMRLIPQLVAGPKLPFWDSTAFYNETLQLISNGTLPNYFPGLYFLFGFMSLLTGIPIYWVSKIFPPIVNALTVFPIYLLGKAVSGNKDVGLLAALLFGTIDVCVLRQSYYVSEGAALLFIPLIYYLLVEASKRRNSIAISTGYTILSLILSIITFIYHLPAGLVVILPIFLYILLCLLHLRWPPKPFIAFSILSVLGLLAFLMYSAAGRNYIFHYINGQIQGLLLFIKKMPPLSIEKLCTESKVLTENPHTLWLMIGSVTTFFLSIATMLFSLRTWIKERKTEKIEEKHVNILFLFSWFFITAATFAASLLIGLAFGSEAYVIWEIGEGGFWIYPYRAMLYLTISAIIPASLSIIKFNEKYRKSAKILTTFLLGMILITSILFQITVTNIYLPTSYGP